MKVSTVLQQSLLPGVVALALVGLTSCTVNDFLSHVSGPGLNPTPPPNRPPKNLGQKQQPTVSWHFDRLELADGMPSTDVYLVVNGKRHLIVNNANQGYQELQPGGYTHMGVPRNRLAACLGWWAGGGDLIYVMREGPNLAVYQKPIDEGGEGYTPPRTSFRKSHTIPF